MLAVAFMTYTFLACVILANNFIVKLWLEVASWGFKTMPDIIIEFSLEGSIGAMILKIFLTILLALLLLYNVDNNIGLLA